MSEHPLNEIGRTEPSKTLTSAKASEGELEKIQKHEELKSQSENVEPENIHASTGSVDARDVRVVDLLDSLKLATNVEVKDKIEVARLQLESERLAVEKKKVLSDQKFWVRNFGTTITAIISLAAVLVSLSQIWVASIQKDKEIEIARTQKDKEMEVSVSQQNQAWRLDIAKFVLEHRDRLLGRDRAQRELMRTVMLATFPPEYSVEIIARLEATTSSPEIRQELQNVRTTVLPRINAIRDTSGNQRSLRPPEPLAEPTTSSNLATPTPSSSIVPKPTPLQSCRCPPPFKEGIDCWGWDDAAFCRVIDGKCVARCVTARTPFPDN